MDHTLVFARRLGMLGLALALFPCAGSPRAVAAEDNPATVPVILLPAEGNPLVALRFVLRTGSQDDPPGKEGLAALTAAMVTEGGTANYPYDELLARFYPMAASLNGACHKEITAFSGTVHHDNLKHFLPLALEMLTKPRFAPKTSTASKTRRSTTFQRPCAAATTKNSASGDYRSPSTKTTPTAMSIKEPSTASKRSRWMT